VVIKKERLTDEQIKAERDMRALFLSVNELIESEEKLEAREMKKAGLRRDDWI
jgi:hypothetical protein